MPCRTSRDSVRPNPGENRKSAITSAIWSRSARLATVKLDNACARSSADAWVKCTMYTGARLVASRSCNVSVSGTRVYEKCSGTGRSTFAMTAVSRPVRSVRSLAKNFMSPRVADISTNWARFSSSSGTCQAQPRCESP